MTKIITQDEFISDLAGKSRFSKSDCKIIYDEIVALFEGYAREGTTVKLRSFGRMYSQIIPERKGSKGEILPETTRIIFRLAENIRYADRTDEFE